MPALLTTGAEIDAVVCLHSMVYCVLDIVWVVCSGASLCVCAYLCLPEDHQQHLKWMLLSVFNQ